MKTTICEQEGVLRQHFVQQLSLADAAAARYHICPINYLLINRIILTLHKLNINFSFFVYQILET